jgi:hypothetical protein
MELSEACEKLADMIQDDPFMRWHSGDSILSFHNHLNRGETAAMALALVKRECYEMYGQCGGPVPLEC